ncbi:AMP-binding protein [Haloferula rosea]|uniref:AMP-binding protein n=1 Tax=Haloferula rosea TaxID=490093 RepID=A0A934RFN8_9BACT|nr:AMP-binding protein [Haloferula rosea]MBK1828296.1 AMP-binding protein [Haloferula rosea]
MLLNRWIETLATHRDRPAIHEMGEARTFADIAAALDARPEATGPVIAQGSAFEIAVASLHGWRDGQPVLPIEQRDHIPQLPAHPGPQIAHLKRVPSNNQHPRFALFTAAQIAADADRLVPAMGLTPDIPNLAAISLAHSYGYSNVILPLLLHGIPIQCVDVPFPASIVAAMKPHTRVNLPAVPSMWRAWHRAGILKDAPIHLALTAGAPLTSQLELSVWENDGLKLHNFYGASECGGISWDPTDEPRELADSLGVPLPGVDAQLDQAGHFVIGSSSVAQGYLPAHETDPIIDGRFHTADGGHLQSGQLILDARGGEQINVAGRKLGPGRIELAIQKTGLADRARIFGVPSSDPERVDEIAVLLPARTDIDTLRAMLGKSLAGWQLPRHWFIADDSSLWSKSRADLRDQFTDS